MGQIIAHTPERWIEVEVEGGSSIDYIEILHNNTVIHRENIFQAPLDFDRPMKVLLEMGWGESEALTDWVADACIENGTLQNTEPRLRGYDITYPLSETESCILSHLDFPEDNHITLKTRTPRNPTVTSSAVQGLALQLQGTSTMRINGTMNDMRFDIPVSELEKGAKTHYMSGFVSPSFVFHRGHSRSRVQTPFWATASGQFPKNAIGITCASVRKTGNGHGVRQIWVEAPKFRYLTNNLLVGYIVVNGVKEKPYSTT